MEEMAVHLNKDELIKTLQKEINYLSATLEDYEQLHREKEKRHLAALNALIKERDQSRKAEQQQLELVTSLGNQVTKVKEARKESIEKSQTEKSEMTATIDKLTRENGLLADKISQVSSESNLYKEKVAESARQLEECRENYSKMEAAWSKLEKSWKHEKKQLLQELMLQRTSESIKVLNQAKELNAKELNPKELNAKELNAKFNLTQPKPASTKENQPISYQKKYENLKKIYLSLLKQLDYKETTGE